MMRVQGAGRGEYQCVGRGCVLNAFRWQRLAVNSRASENVVVSDGLLLHMPRVPSQGSDEGGFRRGQRTSMPRQSGGHHN